MEDPDVVKLLETGLQRLDLDFNYRVYRHYEKELRFLKSVTCPPSLFQSLPAEMSINHLPQLKNLNILVYIASEDIERLDEIVNDVKMWYRSDNEDKKTLVLSTDISEPYFSESKIVEFFTHLIELNSENDFKFKIDKLPHMISSHTILNCFSNFNAENSIVTLAINPYMDDTGLQDLKKVDTFTSLKKLSVEFKEPPTSRKMVPFSFTFSSCSIVSLFICSNSVRTIDLSFEKMSMLKKIHLKNCVLGFRCLDSLPSQLVDLNLDLINSDFHSRDNDLKLPKHLQTLQVTGYPHDGMFVKVLNAGYLDELNALSFTMSESSQDKDSSSYENLDATESQLKSLVHSFPPNIKRLNFENVPAELLAHNTLPFVEDFIFSSLKLGENFNLSILPSSHCLTLKTCFETFSGGLSSRLEFLDIELSYYESSFMEFWEEFISPLQNLRCLNALIVLDGELDFRKLEFPPRLHTIELINKVETCQIIFNELPPSLVQFGYSYSMDDSDPDDLEPNLVFFKLKEGQSAESVTKIFDLRPQDRYNLAVY
ncbi:unnamed protein product [Ambrosiozyma monospora]|uniref:Unnamed protein product n=1 Tax=Ambrosiozyma monospora TaxID=43982 RepID=A0ACB5T0R0_AMBMO|nr:unnamed protein product [Ambrosiozyma monospora]